MSEVSLETAILLINAKKRSGDLVAGVTTKNDPRRKMIQRSLRKVNASGFRGAFATGVACQRGTRTLPDTVPSLFLDLLILHLFRSVSPTCRDYPDVSLCIYPSVLSRLCSVAIGNLWNGTEQNGTKCWYFQGWAWVRMIRFRNHCNIFGLMEVS